MNPVVAALSARLGQPTVRKGGAEYEFECPWCGHDHGKRKLGVNVRRAVYHCWRCHESGRLSDLLEDLNIELSFEVKAPLSQELGSGPTEAPANIPEFVPFSLMEKKWGTLANDAADYAAHRGRMTREALIRSGWGISTDPRWTNRLIVPLTAEGKLVSFFGRAVGGEEPKEKGAPRSQGWWPRSEAPLGLDEVKERRPVVLVEGMWDRQAVLRSTSFECVALLGTSLSESALGRLMAKNPTTVTLCLDGDEAGRRATAAIVAQVVRRRFNAWFCVATVPDGADPDELTADDLERVLDRDAVGATAWALQAAARGRNR